MGNLPRWQSRTQQSGYACCSAEPVPAGCKVSTNLHIGLSRDLLPPSDPGGNTSPDATTEPRCLALPSLRLSSVISVPSVVELSAY